MATRVGVGGATYPQRRGETAVTPAEGKSLVPAFAGRCNLLPYPPPPEEVRAT